MTDSGPLGQLLLVARDRGFLGPGDVAFHVEHSRLYLEAIAAAAPAARTLADLGSGAGVPGLLIASERPDLAVTLVDAAARRCAFLEEAVAELGLVNVDVRRGRAEVVGRDPALRGRFDVVTARGFGPPAATAECAAPLLAEGGALVVSDPRDDDARWSPDGLSILGMAVSGRAGSTEAPLSVIAQMQTCPERFPRGDGRPRKRPLF